MLTDLTIVQELYQLLCVAFIITILCSKQMAGDFLDTTECIHRPLGLPPPRVTSERGSHEMH